MLTLAPLFWACNSIVGRALASDVPPLALTFTRWLLAVLMLAPFAWRHLVRDWPIVRANWKALLLLGVVGTGMHNALSYLGLNYTTATNAVILNSFVPVMIIAISWIFLGERLSATQLTGVAVSTLGVFTILSHGSLSSLWTLRLNAGDLFVIASLFMWSMYTIGLRWRPAGMHLLSFLLVIAIVGECAILPLVVLEAVFVRATRLSIGNLAAIAFVALCSSVLSYVMWNRAVERVGASVAGLFVHLMPVFGVMLAWIFLRERLAGFHLAGIALILSGIYITSRLGHRNVPAPAGTD